MRNYTVYRITFETQLHLGRTAGPAQESTLGLENTETYIPADTLFSAICQTWTTFYGTESLTDFLSGYNEDGTDLPFTLTSAFPFAKDVYLFPKPLTFVDPSKKSKRLQFVSQNIFHDIISGNRPQFNDDDLVNSEKVWLTPEEKTQLKALNEGSIVWTTQTRPRVTIGSQNAGSEIWHVETIQFNTDCGLWFAARFDTHETQQKIETLLRALGDTGIGGERNAGYGMFTFSTENTIDLPTAETGNPFVTLSPVCPKSPQQLSELLKGKVAYAVNPITGWTSTTGTAMQRKQVNMFTEGSVLYTGEEQPIGRLIDLSPNGYAHPVYRYGYAWQVGIKGISE